MATHRYIRVRTHQKGLIVRFEDQFLFGEIVAEILKIELNQLLRDYSPEFVIIDFTGVKSISSAVIGSLLAARGKLLASGGHFRFCSVPSSVEGVLKTLNLYETVFQVYDDVQAALKAHLNTLQPEIALELQDE